MPGFSGFRMNDLMQKASTHSFVSSKRVLDPPIGITRRQATPQMKLSIGRLNSRVSPVYHPPTSTIRAHSTADLIKDISIPGKVRRGCSACGRG